MQAALPWGLLRRDSICGGLKRGTEGDAQPLPRILGTATLEPGPQCPAPVLGAMSPSVASCAATHPWDIQPALGTAPGAPLQPKDGAGSPVLVPPPVLVAPPCWRAAWGRGGPCVTLEGHLRNEGGEGGQKLALSLPPLPSSSPPSPLHPQILQIPSRPRAPSPRFFGDAQNGSSSPRRPPHPRLKAQILSLCWSLGCHTRNVTRAEFPPVSPWRLRCGRAAAAGIHPRGRTGRESRQRCRCPRLLPAVAFAVLSSPHTKPRSWHPDALQHAPEFKPLGCQIKPRVSYEPKIILGL